MSKEPNKDKPLGKNERVKLDMSFEDALRMAINKQPIKPMSTELKLYEEGDKSYTKHKLLIKSVNQTVRLYNIQLRGYDEVNPEDYVVEIYIGAMMRDTPVITLSLYQNAFIKGKNIGFFIKQDNEKDKPYILTTKQTQYGDVYLLLKKKKSATDKKSATLATLVYDYQ